MELARYLVATERDLDEALVWALIALQASADPEWRFDVARWFARVGRVQAAAGLTRPGASADAADAKAMLEVGWIHARAGRPEDAARAIRGVAKDQQLAPEALRLLAELSAVGGGVIAPHEIAESLVDAAVRTAAQGGDPFRMLEVAFLRVPQSVVATRAFASTLAALGKLEAADEVFRRHAEALSDRAERAHVHKERVFDAEARDDAGGMLVAAIDGEFDYEGEHADEATLVRALGRAGLGVCAVAFAMRRAARAAKDERRELLVRAARLADEYRLAELGAWIWAEVLVFDPGNEEARVALAAMDPEPHDLELAALVAAVRRQARADASKRADAIVVERIEVLASRGGDKPRLEPSDGVHRDELGDVYVELVGEGARLPEWYEAWAALLRYERPPVGGKREEGPIWRALAWAAEKSNTDVADRRLMVAIDTRDSALTARVATALAGRARRRGDSERARELMRGDGARRDQSLRALVEMACELVGAPAVTVGADAAEDRVSLLESVVERAFADPAWTDELGRMATVSGDDARAIAWSMKSAVVRGAGAGEVVTLLDRARAAKLVDALTSVIEWTLDLPLAAADVDRALGAALRQLVELDAIAAAPLAKRVLDSFGPASEFVFEALARAAERAGDVRMVATVVTRRLAFVEDGSARRRLWPDLVRAWRDAEDVESELRSLARALAEGCEFVDIEERLDSFDVDKLSGDGVLALLESQMILALRQGDIDRARQLSRELGGARWDIGGEVDWALEAWVPYVDVSSASAVATLGVDVARIAGAATAIDVLVRLSQSTRDSAGVVTVLGVAAEVALALGLPAKGLDLASEALARDPTRTPLVSLAERGAIETGRSGELTALYAMIAGRALGRYGRRAAHYRGARFYEQVGDAELALHHAAAAFRAVPSDGLPFVLLRRLAERAGDASAAVEAVEDVSSSMSGASQRAAWLVRAAQLCAPGADGLSRSIDLLLRAASTADDPEILRRLSQAVRAYARLVPDDRVVLDARMEAAVRHLSENVEGPSGARRALHLARLALDSCSNHNVVLEVLERAWGADASLDEFVVLEPYVDAIAKAELAGEVYARLAERALEPYANVGAPAFALLAGLAKTLDADRAAEWVVRAATANPEDRDIVRLAVSQLGDVDETLRKRFDDACPPGIRVRALRELAAQAATRSDTDAAMRWIDEAELFSDSDDAREALSRHRAALRALSGDADDLSGQATPEATPQAIAVEAQDSTEPSEPPPLAPDGAPQSEHIATPALGETLVDRALRTRDEDSLLALMAEVEAHPHDDIAIDAIDELVHELGAWDSFAEHLDRRARALEASPLHDDEARAARFRRATVLEQRLGRIDMAVAELERLRENFPHHSYVARFLADLYARSGDADRSAIIWRELGEQTGGPETLDDVDLRAVEAHLQAEEFDQALAAVRRVVVRSPHNLRALELWLDLAQRLDDESEIGKAAEACAKHGVGDAESVRDLWILAAQSAARLGDVARAIDRADQACELFPTHAPTQLFACGLAYRMRRAGSEAEALVTIDRLSRFDERLVDDDAALRAFLLAEAFDRVSRRRDAQEVLEAAAERMPQHPLVALGLAERAVRDGEDAKAAGHYETALSGNLLGLRSRGRAALEASVVAQRLDRHQAAIALAELAVGEPELRASALMRLAAVAASAGDATRSRAALRELARSNAAPEQRREALAQLGRLLYASGDPHDWIEGDRAFSEAIECEADEGARAALDAEREGLRRKAAAAPARTRPPPSGDPGGRSRAAWVPLGDEDEAPTATHDSSELARESTGGHVDAGEIERLWHALEAGDSDAGETIVAHLDPESDSLQIVRVRIAQCLARPGDALRLSVLREAAIADQNLSLARAVDHLIRAFDPGAGPLPPPPLASQPVQPGLRELLTQPAVGVLSEVFEPVTATLAGQLARLPQHTTVTGIDRVQRGAGTALGELLEDVHRLAPFAPVPVFHRRSSEVPVPQAIFMPDGPAAVLEGDVTAADAETRYAFGAALAAASPMLAPCLGILRADAEKLWHGIQGAFGPGGAQVAASPQAANWVELLWDLVPANAQRRIQDVLDHAPRDFDVIWSIAASCQARVAFFVCADFAIAARRILGDEAVDHASERGPTAALATLLAEPGPLRSVWELAVSAEFAQARWHPPASTSRSSRSSSTLRLG